MRGDVLAAHAADQCMDGFKRRELIIEMTDAIECVIRVAVLAGTKINAPGSSTCMFACKLANS